jgi:hypothetical protein
VLNERYLCVLPDSLRWIVISRSYHIARDAFLSGEKLDTVRSGRRGPYACKIRFPSDSRCDP